MPRTHLLSPRRIPPPLSVALFLLLPACTGSIGSHSSAGSGSTSGTTAASSGGAVLPVPGQTGTGSGGAGQTSVPIPMPQGSTSFPPTEQAFRRLTVRQFGTSLQSLLGNLQLLPIQADGRDNGLAVIGAATVVTSQRGVEQYQEAIDSALDQVFSDSTRRNALMGCSPTLTPDDACSRGFLERFGRLAWRRALLPAELARYQALAFSSAQALSDPVAGLRWASSALLQSPYFLYRTEVGDAVPSQPGWFALTGSELASRLAYALWDAPPDDALLKAAEAGALSTTDGLNREAARLLSVPAGRASVGDFARDYFGLEQLGGIAKDTTLFPSFTPTLAASMAEEIAHLYEASAFEGTGNMLDLFTTHTRYLNPELAALYGVGSSALAPDFSNKLELSANEGRAGLLATSGILSLFANQTRSSPSRRGKFIREKLLCQTIPLPPPNVPALKDPPPGVMMTRRESLLQHNTDPVCASCHSLMDPLGFGLENFDAIGAYRNFDQGKPIDATGNLNGTSFDGPEGLAKVLVATPEVSACLAKSFYQYATASSASTEAAGAMQQLADTFAQGGHQMLPLITSIVNGDGFRFVSTPKAQP